MVPALCLKADVSYNERHTVVRLLEADEETTPHHQRQGERNKTMMKSVTTKEAIALADFVVHGLVHPRYLTYWEEDGTPFYVMDRGKECYLKSKEQWFWTSESAELFSEIDKLEGETFFAVGLNSKKQTLVKTGKYKLSGKDLPAVFTPTIRVNDPYGQPEEGYVYTGKYIFEKESALPVFCKRVLRREAEKIKDEGRIGKQVAWVLAQYPRCEMLLIVSDVELATEAIRELIETTPEESLAWFLSGKDPGCAKAALTELSKVEQIRTPLRCL